MKKILVLVCLLSFGLTHAQKEKSTFKKVGDLVKATYYYKDGNIKQQGFFKDNKLTGTWVTFDTAGNKTAIANYKAGKKVGKWFIVDANGVKEVTFKNNKITQVIRTEVALK